MAKPDPGKLKDIHSCLQDSAFYKTGETLEENVVVRVKESTKTQLKAICRRHGTDMSAFARRVFEQVVEDYGGDSAES